MRKVIPLSSPNFEGNEKKYVEDAHNLGEIPESFVTSEYEDVDEEIFRKYSIQNWCRNMLNYLN